MFNDLCNINKIHSILTKRYNKLNIIAVTGQYDTVRSLISKVSYKMNRKLSIYDASNIKNRINELLLPVRDISNGNKQLTMIRDFEFANADTSKRLIEMIHTQKPKKPKENNLVSSSIHFNTIILQVNKLNPIVKSLITNKGVHIIHTDSDSNSFSSSLLSCHDKWPYNMTLDEISSLLDNSCDKDVTNTREHKYIVDSTHNIPVYKKMKVNKRLYMDVSSSMNYSLFNSTSQDFDVKRSCIEMDGSINSKKKLNLFNRCRFRNVVAKCDEPRSSTSIVNTIRTTPKSDSVGQNKNISKISQKYLKYF